MKVFRINEHIMQYRFGEPIETDSVVLKGEEVQKGYLDFLTIEVDETIRVRYKMDTEDIILGLGENQRGMNRRGGIYESYCTDDPNHTPNKRSLYGAHNFLMVDGKKKFGIFIDFPSKVIFDIGFAHRDYLDIRIEGKHADIYVIEQVGRREIVRNFLMLICDGYAPPKWAFGYQQSRWSYPNGKEVEKIVDSFVEHNIPCDAVYLDIDYMEDFKDFTVDKNRFPDFEGFVKRIKDKGFRLIPIIDAGVKIEKGYDVYEEGIKKKYFCVDQKDEPFVAAVWPGRVHFPDFLNPDVRKWFGLKYQILTDCGIEGFWNDMNEPAIFYTERGLQQAFNRASQSVDENLDIYSFFQLKDTFDSLMNNLEDHKSFYHYMNGKKVNHYDVHNLYGFNMTRAAAEGLKEICTNKRYLLFSRASYIGMHRYSGIWTGDNHSWWEHILLNVKMMPALNMCGFLYAGADTGGFNEDANEQLLIRWMQFSLFTPLFRNHAAMGTRQQEPFAYDEESIRIMRSVIMLRYALVPYLYAEYMKALIHKDVYFAPLSFDYNDEMSRRTESQVLVGESLMAAPVCEENAKGRYVWLPEDMLLWRAVDYRVRSFKVMNKGHHYINVMLNETPIFIRKNKLLVIGCHAQNVESLNTDELTVIGFVKDEAAYVYYDDDGKTEDFKKGKYWEMTIKVQKCGEDFQITVDHGGNTKVKKLNFEIVDENGHLFRKTMAFE
ncbi:MAG: TIM-barrel domain-containing protein [Bacillota bacterium]